MVLASESGGDSERGDEGEGGSGVGDRDGNDGGWRQENCGVGDDGGSEGGAGGGEDGGWVK